MIERLDPAEYRRTPWKNGGGISVEIAAEHFDAGGDGWAGLVWSFSRTGFDVPSPFSDLTGTDRIIAVIEGNGLTLRATDGGEDVAVGGKFQPAAFDGGKPVEGVPDGPIRVANVMGRQGRVKIGMRFLQAGQAAKLAADVLLLHACAGPATVHVLAGESYELENDEALRANRASLQVMLATGTLLVASIDRV
jgi:uncharacterized protein